VLTARQLQREGRWEEAIVEWREVVRTSPRETSAYLGLGRAYEKTGQPQLALATYLELVKASPTLANTLVAADRIDQLNLPDQNLRIALLGNATLDHLNSYLKVACYAAGLRPQIYQAGFDQYTQEILNPTSGLYAFAPDVVICAIHSSRLFPTIHDYPFDLSVAERHSEIDAGLKTLDSLLEVLTSRTPAMVLVHNFVSPQYPVLGILDARDEFGQAAAFAEINTRVAELARTKYKSVYVVDEERIQSRSGKSEATDARTWLTARMPWSESVLSRLSREYLRFIRAAKGLSRKCVVLDLDNTLWGGVVGEDGLAGIQLGAEAPGNAFVAFQRELERLWRRGILLAICSKNNPDDALPVFEHHPEMVLKLSHFAAQRINWQPKSQNIAEIARELNIGLDSLVFLDDNPVERAAVRAALPQVLTPELPTDPAEYRRALLEVAEVFDTLAVTAEDRDRNRLYVEQRARQEAQTAIQAGGSSLEDYLADLQIVVDIEPDTEVSLPRIAQLTGKTNQFNLTTRRYTEAEILQKKSEGWRVYSARVGDRFGDNGLTGVALVAPSRDTWTIDSLLLSCRVMGRGVETAILAYLVDEARRAGATFLDAEYLPTPKNDVVRNLYRDHGFTQVGSGDTATRWRLNLADSAIQAPPYLTVRLPSLV
jgi:FkbH-like protein